MLPGSYSVSLPVSGYYDVAVGIRPVDLRAGILQGAQGLLCRVAVVVARPDFNDATGRHNPAQEGWAGSGGAAMVADLQDIALQVVSGGEEAILGYDAGVSHEQEGDLPIYHPKDDGVLVQVTRKQRCWRREDFDLEAGVEIDGLTPFSYCKRYALLIYQRQVGIEGRRCVGLAAVQDLPHSEVIENG